MNTSKQSLLFQGKNFKPNSISLRYEFPVWQYFPFQAKIAKDLSDSAQFMFHVYRKCIQKREFIAQVVKYMATTEFGLCSKNYVT